MPQPIIAARWPFIYEQLLVYSPTMPQRTSWCKLLKSSDKETAQARETLTAYWLSVSCSNCSLLELVSLRIPTTPRNGLSWHPSRLDGAGKCAAVVSRLKGSSHLSNFKRTPFWRFLLVDHLHIISSWWISSGSHPPFWSLVSTNHWPQTCFSLPGYWDQASWQC